MCNNLVCWFQYGIQKGNKILGHRFNMQPCHELIYFNMCHCYALIGNLYHIILSSWVIYILCLKVCFKIVSSLYDLCCNCNSCIRFQTWHNCNTFQYHITCKLCGLCNPMLERDLKRGLKRSSSWKMCELGFGDDWKHGNLIAKIWLKNGW